MDNHKVFSKLASRNVKISHDEENLLQESLLNIDAKFPKRLATKNILIDLQRHGLLQNSYQGEVKGRKYYNCFAFSYLILDTLKNVSAIFITDPQIHIYMLNFQA